MFPGMEAAEAWLGRSGKVGRCKLGVLFKGGMCPEENVTEGMCSHDLQLTGQLAWLHRASAFLAHKVSMPWDPELCGTRGTAASIPPALPTPQIFPQKEGLRKAKG